MLFRWQSAPGADSYTLVFARAQSSDSLFEYQADLTQPTFTIPVAQPQSITVPYGVRSALDTSPLAEYPALQYVLKLRDLAAMLSAQPVGVPFYYVWTIEAHAGSNSARSIEKHRITIIRS